MRKNSPTLIAAGSQFDPATSAYTAGVEELRVRSVHNKAVISPAVSLRNTMYRSTGGATVNHVTA
jgi:hypothetical protein